MQDREVDLHQYLKSAAVKQDGMAIGPLRGNLKQEQMPEFFKMMEGRIFKVLF